MKLHFHLIDNAEVISDDEGQDFSDIESARAEAVASIRELVLESLRTQQNLRLDRALRIVDDRGRVVEEINFADAILRE